MSKTKYRPKWTNSEPRWWRNLVASRPMRRESALLEKLALQGVPLDELPELTPHNRFREYYW